MRLISLRIQNVRGIKDSTFDLAGENMVLSGPNGSGKSAVIDAVDFLLTGKMSRLEGEGTRGITLKSHGPHVDHEPSETVVEAEVKLKSIPEPIRISRSLASPGDLDYPEEAEEAIESVLETAKKGQHALSRRQILRFIAKINDFRGAVGAGPLKDLKNEDLRSNVTPPGKLPSMPREVSNFSGARDAILRHLADAKQLVLRLDGQLRSAIAEINKSKEAQEALKRLQLLKLGISLLPEDGSCPLCGLSWPPGELVAHLESHIKKAEDAQAKEAEVNRAAEQLREHTVAVETLVSQLDAAAKALGLEPQQKTLAQWLSVIREYDGSLQEPMEKYGTKSYPEEFLSSLFAPAGLEEDFNRMEKEISQRFPEPTEQQKVWDTLTRAVEPIERYLKWKGVHPRAQEAERISKQLARHFEEGRDAALGSLYAEIEGRFSELYRAIHQEDEGSFESSLSPSGAGLKLEVDFHGRGKFPPLAVHSEGHQDSMGLCLYLALAERLTTDVIELTMLDDVVMSIDSGHRRKVCEMVNDHFKDRQFLITTHDRTWARQLQGEGVVPRNGHVQFSRWSVDTGPILAIEPDLWEKIHQYLEKDDVSEAAITLRRNAEEFMESVCDALRAPVPYRSDGGNDLGEYASGAIGAYGKRLKEAKGAANSWNRQELVQKLEEQQSIAGSIFKRTQIEHWTVNAAVHYNNWANLTRADFLPVVEA